MSYILEALRKSQQERDLGQVPTLESLPAVGEESEPPGIHYWSVAAVFLASLAVLIALYAALRRDPQPGAPPPAPAATVRAFSAPDAAPVPLAPTPDPVPASPRPETPEPPAMPAPPREASPPPRAATPPQSRPAPPPPVEIPEDVRQEIEAFKQELRGEQPDGSRIPPHQLRLPPELQEQLPSFVLTVHIYDQDPARRFVLIDGRRLREGARTRQGIEVEEILPSGVVLRYEGHRFFHRR